MGVYLNRVIGRRQRMAAGVVLIVLALAGCAGRMTGGGVIPSASDPNGSAHFAFEYAITNQADGSGRMTGMYHDGAVQLRFDEAQSSPPETSGTSCIQTTADYTSQDQATPGAGTAFIEACDNAGTGQPDLFSISVTTGPYAGYSDEGAVTQGSLTVHGE